MLTIPNLATQDKYVDALTLGPVPTTRQIKYVVANKAVLMRVWPKLKSGTIPAQTDELLVTPETNVITDAIGVQFRSALPGVPAQVIAQLLEPGDPTFGSGTPFSATITSSGGIQPGVTSVQIQKNGGAIGTEPALDFVDVAGARWAVTDDPANTRVLVSLASVSFGTLGAGPPAAPSDGDIWVAKNVGANGEWWAFQYDAAWVADAFKWKFIGGPPVSGEGNLGGTNWNLLTQIGVTGWWYWNNGAVILTAVRAGVYLFRGGSYGVNAGVASQGSTALGSPSAGTAAINASRRDYTFTPGDSTTGNFSYETLAAAVAGQTFANVWSGSAQFGVNNNQISVTPLRII